MAEKFDFKKEYKGLYHPKTTPALIDVPPIRFIMVDGKGDPNTSKDYAEALELLYGLSFSIKMSKMSDTLPQDTLIMWYRPWRDFGGWGQIL